MRCFIWQNTHFTLRLVLSEVTLNIPVTRKHTHAHTRYCFSFGNRVMCGFGLQPYRKHRWFRFEAIRYMKKHLAWRPPATPAQWVNQAHHTPTSRPLWNSFFTRLASKTFFFFSFLLFSSSFRCSSFSGSIKAPVLTLLICVHRYCCGFSSLLGAYQETVREVSEVSKVRRVTDRAWP